MRAFVLVVGTCVGCSYDLGAFQSVVDAVGDVGDTGTDTAMPDVVVTEVLDAMDDEAGVDVTACRTAADTAACLQCCTKALPVGAAKVWQQAGDCLCNGAHCKVSCAATACAKAPLSANAVCAKCLKLALPGCGKTGGKPFQDCVTSCP